MKIYIDTRHRTDDSASSSDFTIELNETIELPPRCKVRVWNLCVPYSWYTVEQGVNHLLYISEKDVNNSQVYRTITLPAGQYDGPKLATAIRDGFNASSIYTPKHAHTVYGQLQRSTRNHHYWYNHGCAIHAVWGPGSPPDDHVALWRRRKRLAAEVLQS